jgi:hypothetical protein
MTRRRRRSPTTWSCRSKRWGDPEDRAGARVSETPIGEEEDSHSGTSSPTRTRPSRRGGVLHAFEEQLSEVLGRSRRGGEGPAAALRIGACAQNAREVGRDSTSRASASGDEAKASGSCAIPAGAKLKTFKLRQITTQEPPFGRLLEQV